MKKTDTALRFIFIGSIMWFSMRFVTYTLYYPYTIPEVARPSYHLPFSPSMYLFPIVFCFVGSVLLISSKKESIKQLPAKIKSRLTGIPIDGSKDRE